MMRPPRDLIGRLEAGATLPAGDGDRFGGYGVMGLPFRTGHLLALRRFPASSLGAGYSAVWHRDPAGAWTFYADIAPELSCSRFFGPAVARSCQHRIDLTWTGPRDLRIEIPAVALTWQIGLHGTPATGVLNGVAAALPAPLWRRPAALAGIGRAAGWLLRTGRLSLTGTAPNGQRFRARPRRVWLVDRSSARLGGVDLGEPGPLRPQAFLGEFALPQRGLFLIGSACFAPPDEVRRPTGLTAPTSARA